MKKVIKNTKKGILMVAMFATVIGYANRASYSINNEAKKVSLKLKNVKKGNQLSIIDNNGIILYKEFIEQPGVYSKSFDLTTLPDGYYFFELDKDLEIKTIPFVVIGSKVEFKKNKEKIIFKPLVRVKDDRIIITKLSLNQDPIKIDIYYINADEYTLINSEKINDTQIIERIYKLDSNVKGSYKIICKSEGKTFEEYINI